LNEDIDLWLRLGTAPGFVYIEHPPSFAQRQHGGNTSGVINRSVRGLEHLWERECTGRYPGGSDRRAARLKLMTYVARSTSVQALATEDRGAAWGVYRKFFRAHLRLGRWRYLLGFPV